VRDRNNIIDAFRGVAILSVVAFHFTVRWAPPRSSVDLYGYEGTFDPTFNVLAFGVHLFFIISGMVITMTILRSANVWEFGFKRFARIYPAFAVATSLTFLCMQSGPELFRTDPWDYFSSLLIDSSLLGGRPVDGVYWSLVVEVHFYAFVAAAYLALGHRFWLGLLCLAAISSATFLVVPGFSARFLLAPYWPFFLAGIAMWYWVFENARSRALACLTIAFVCYITTYNTTHTNAPALLIDVYLLGTILLLLFALNLHPTARFPLLSTVGRVSYSIYLVHQYIGVSLIGAATRAGISGWVSLIAATTVVFAVGAVLYLIVEQPCNQALLRLYRRLSSRSGTPPEHDVKAAY
jgi:peptidoglycan/LPS O-acetylase OafA/YrhL